MDKFELIDMKTWDRAEVYKLYTEVWTTTTYSVTKKLSVGKMVDYLKERGMKFVPAIMWLISREINRIDNFKFALHNGKLGKWDVVHPMFPTLNANENMTFHGLEYKEDFKLFYESYLAERKENLSKTCLWANNIPENFFMVSIFPWLHFDGCSMQMQNAKGYYAPFIAVGQFNAEKELPCMLMGNHAVADAWHVAKFFTALQEGMDNPSEWCK